MLIEYFSFRTVSSSWVEMKHNSDFSSSSDTISSSSTDTAGEEIIDNGGKVI